MTRHEIQTHLRALERERRPFLIRDHVDALADALREPWIDAELAGEVNAALARFGESRGWSPARLRVGETYLLLCDPGARRGTAVRWRSRGGTGTLRFGAECEEALDRAWRGLLAEVSVEGRSLPGDFVRGGFEAPDLVGAPTVDGGSLCVSACVGWLSRACHVAVPEDLAASAEVGSDGRLHPVELLAEKLAALRDRWPMVTRVVVADRQRLDGELPRGISLLPCVRLRDVFEHFKLPCGALPECSVDVHVRRLGDFDLENKRTHGTAAWRDLSAQAWATAAALGLDETERRHAEAARTWAALFALHAGDHASAREISKSLHGAEQPVVAAWRDLVAASAAIDGERFDEAQELAERVAREARHLPADHHWIEGHARGTKGRALLHGGRHVAARVALEDAVRWFQERSQPWEAARTSKDLAACMRLTGRVDEALPLIDRAYGWLDTARNREVSAKTRHFLRLEHGRCLLVAGRPAEALAAFERVVDVQAADVDYPRLGALRGLVVAHRRLGRVTESRAVLRRCLAAAEARAPGDVLGRVAAIAAAEADADGDGEAVMEARAAWERHFPRRVGSEDMREVLARQVY